ncbi:unnamed protein product [Arctogadus glacialis]
MFSEGAASEPRLRRVLALFDMEAAAVVAILLGIAQLLLSSPLYYLDVSLPKSLFILPLFIGTLFVIGGSLTIASARSSSKSVHQSCAYSNVACLLGAVLALCLYCFSLSSVKQPDCVEDTEVSFYHSLSVDCLEGRHVGLFWNVVTLLLCYNVGALLLHGLLTVTSIRALRSP